MDNQTKETVETILTNLGDKDIQTEVSESEIVNMADEFNRSVIGFFDSRLKSIQSQESIKELIQEKLKIKLKEEELSVAQLKDLFVVFSRETSTASQDIMTFVQPETFQKKVESQGSDLSVEQQRQLDTLFRLLQQSEFS